MQELKPYAAYKDSGVAWLGQIPKEWEVKRLGKLCSKIGSGKTPSGGAETYEKQGVLFLRSQNIYDDGLFLKDATFINEDVDFEMRNSRVLPLDILLNITGASLGRTCIVPDLFPNANVNQHVCIIRLENKEFSHYVSLFLKSKVSKGQIEFLQTGAAREGLSFVQLAQIILPFPPLPEQQAIASFLDAQCARIDSLVEKKQKLLRLLEEKRRALITHAVTRGLDDSAPLKDSGVAWLGQVPQGWEVIRLKFCVKSGFQYGANISAENEEPSFPRYIRITDMNDNGTLKENTFRSLLPEEAEPYLLQDKDILLARSGATVGKSFMYKQEMGIAAYAGYLIRVSTNEKLLPEYLYACVNSQSYWQWIKSIYIQATIQNVSAEKYSNFMVVSPPIAEQQGIVDYLDEQCALIDTQKVHTEKSIQLLQEYRASLITHAVTGKIDVRKAVQ